MVLFNVFVALARHEVPTLVDDKSSTSSSSSSSRNTSSQNLSLSNQTPTTEALRIESWSSVGEYDTTSIYQSYVVGSSESCERLLIAQPNIQRQLLDPHQQRKKNSERRRSYGIGGAGNIRRPSEVIHADRVDAVHKSKRNSTRSFSIDGIFPNLWKKMSRTKDVMESGRR